MRHRRHSDKTTRRRNDAYEHTRRDASAGWRDEYLFQAVAGDMRADGGRFVLPEPGARVADKETGDDLVVVRVHPDTRARDEYIESLDATVAAVNHTYNPDAPIAEVVYVDSLDTLDGWRTVEDLRDAVSFGAVESYTFPCDRLEVAE